MNVIENSIQLIGDILNSFTISCNQSVSISNQISWVHTINKTGAYSIENSSVISLSNNGQQLNFASLKLSDEEIYSCGILTDNTFKIINNFYLFIRGLAILRLELVYKFKNNIFCS